MMFDHGIAMRIVDGAANQHRNCDSIFSRDIHPLIIIGYEALAEIGRLRGDLDEHRTANAALQRTIDQQVVETAGALARCALAEEVASLQAEVEQHNADYAELDHEFGELLDCFDEDGNPLPSEGDTPCGIDAETLQYHLQRSADMIQDVGDDSVRAVALTRLSWISGWINGQQEERE